MSHIGDVVLSLEITCSQHRTLLLNVTTAVGGESLHTAIDLATEVEVLVH